MQQQLLSMEGELREKQLVFDQHHLDDPVGQPVKQLVGKHEERPTHPKDYEDSTSVFLTGIPIMFRNRV